MNAAVVNLGLDDALDAFGAGAIGGAVSPEVDALIKEAGLKRDQGDQSLALLEQARALAPSHPGPLIALYRFHFYGHALDKARAVGEDALAIARAALGTNFGDQPPDDDTLRHDPAVRFYLFTLKGLAYLSLRLGDFDEARLMLNALRQLDPKDHLGGALLSHVLARREAADTPDAVDPLSAYPVRGWSGNGAKL